MSEFYRSQARPRVIPVFSSSNRRSENGAPPPPSPLSDGVLAQRLVGDVHADEEAAVGVPHGELRVPPVPHAPVRLFGGRAADAEEEEGQRAVRVRVRARVRGDGDGEADRTLLGRVLGSV